MGIRQTWSLGIKIGRTRRYGNEIRQTCRIQDQNQIFLHRWYWDGVALQKWCQDQTALQRWELRSDPSANGREVESCCRSETGADQLMEWLLKCGLRPVKCISVFWPGFRTRPSHQCGTTSRLKLHLR